MKGPEKIIVQVVLDKPLKDAFDYIWDEAFLRTKPKLGMLVELPFGSSYLVGIVVGVSTHSNIELSKLKAVKALSPLPCLDKKIRELAEFASRYYIYGLGETLLPAIPKWWKSPANWEKGLGAAQIDKLSAIKITPSHDKVIDPEQLNQAQADALRHLSNADHKKFQTLFLNGVTGSGKTAVYLNYLQQVISNHRDAQVLILLPEINLTPQLERRIASHMPNQEMAVLHSGLSDKQRARAWYAATTGKAKVILGTRLSILTPIPNLATIVVDEEHDSSFKQQEGLGYSARDLAIWRAKNESIPILLCSATPSLETWHAIERGRYQEIKLSERIHQAQMPIVELIQTQQANAGAMISNVLKQALQNNFQEGRQALIFVNRRGFAPALSCGSCAWLSECPECSGFMVMHKQLGSRKSPVLCCHHCGLIKSVPRSCPKCGDSDLLPLGRGTQKIEEQIGEIIPQAKVLRVDADTARTGKLSEELFTKIHQGEADIIVGTQMLSKGHDYQNIGLVCVLDADARLYSNDYRAPETLFAQLVQVAGRAGRSGGEQAKMLIETRYPNDPVYQYLRNYDLAGFMKHLLKERQDSRLPPYVSQALVHAQSTHMADSLSFLARAKVHIEKNSPNQGRLVCFDPVPKALAKVAGKERAQLLIEAESRTQLQTQLNALDEFLRKQSTGRITKQGKVRWSIERDPLLI